MMHRNLKLMSFMIPLFLFIGCGSEAAPEADLQEAVVVETMVAEVGPSKNRVSYSGTVKPIEQVNLSTKIMGWIEQIYFEEGDQVERGGLLVKLRSEDVEARRAQAEAAIKEAEAHLANVQTNLKRIEALFETNAATQKELDDMKAAFASARAAKIRAEETKKEVQEMLRYTELRAPFPAVVTKKRLEVGDLANPGQPILAVENMRRVKIVAKVPESDVRKLHPGMSARVVVEAANFGSNGASEMSTIDKLVPSADPLSRQFELHVLVDNYDGAIKSGMFARIEVPEEGEMGLMVPEQAVFRRGQLEGLFVVDSGNKARLRWIRTGAAIDGHVEVLSGLNAGEEVVVSMESQLLDGQSVEAKQ